VELADFVLEPFHGHIVRRSLLLHKDILLVELMTQLCQPARIPTTTTVVGVIITLTLQPSHKPQHTWVFVADTRRMVSK
jgi:hypothetical protein